MYKQLVAICIKYCYVLLINLYYILDPAFCIACNLRNMISISIFGYETHVPYPSESEIDVCIKILKQDKATGFDNMMNEYVIISRLYLLSKLYVSCLIVCFILIAFPCCGQKVSWFQYIKKGQSNDLGNCRGISLVSHIGELFTINLRLTRWPLPHWVINIHNYRCTVWFSARYWN